MSTNVFISWSGDLSRKLAEALRDWLPAALQYVKPYFSPEDIEKGTKWNTEIAEMLEASQIGIICLTHDNTEKPWILFEAGALSKSMDKSRVCPLLFDIEPTDVKGPLTSFQATRFVRDDFKRLVITINNSAGDAKLETTVFDNVFDMWWPRLEEQINKIIGSRENAVATERRSDRDILEELLERARTTPTKQALSSTIREQIAYALLDIIHQYNSHSRSSKLMPRTLLKERPILGDYWDHDSKINWWPGLKTAPTADLVALGHYLVSLGDADSTEKADEEQ